MCDFSLPCSYFSRKAYYIQWVATRLVQESVRSSRTLPNASSSPSQQLTGRLEWNLVRLLPENLAGKWRELLRSSIMVLLVVRREERKFDLFRVATGDWIKTGLCSAPDE